MAILLAASMPLFPPKAKVDIHGMSQYDGYLKQKLLENNKLGAVTLIAALQKDHGVVVGMKTMTKWIQRHKGRNGAVPAVGEVESLPPSTLLYKIC